MRSRASGRNTAVLEALSSRRFLVGRCRRWIGPGRPAGPSVARRNPAPPANRWEPLFEGHVCSLGYLLADWIPAYECHGPGDVQGDDIELDEEWFAFLVEAYRLDPVTGRREYDEAVVSRPKGRAKSELAGFVGTAEAFGPVRFAGWASGGEPYPVPSVRETYERGEPMGMPVKSPLLKCLATEESQAGNTFE